MPAKRPNLFERATSELSQDAVLAWLLRWADAPCAEIDDGMHTVARDFVLGLLRLPPNSVAIELPSTARVHVTTQDEQADIVARIGDDILLVIEDKTDTGHHHDQLRRYRDALIAKYGRRLVQAVYLKTGDEASYVHAEKQGWAVCRRRQLLALLRPGLARTDNSILTDFVDHIGEIEAAVEAYAHTPPANWNARAWSGFFIALQDHLRDGGWGYVPNPSGGFMGFWWCERPVPGGGAVYLQLEQDRLCVKFDRRSTTMSDRECMRRVVDGLGVVGITPPKRLRRGQRVTLGVMSGDYRVTSGDGSLDLMATCELLDRVSARLRDEFAL